MKHQNLLLRIAMTAALLFSIIPAFALGLRDSKSVKVGDTFTVYSSGHTRLQSVLWSWDYNSLELVSTIYPTSTSATFKAKKATPSAGVVIQATVYYYASQGSIATGKFFDSWTIYVEDDSTVSLNTSSERLSPGDFFDLKASVSSSSYSGSYKWTSSNSSVASVSGSGNSVRVRAGSSGRATIRVTLDNGKYAECSVVVEDNSTVSLSDTRKDVSTGKNFTLNAYASSGYSGSYTWTSSNSSVAYCSGSGSSAHIEARSSGYATIKVTLTNGASAQCGVYVSDIDVSSVKAEDIRLEAEKSTSAKMTVYPSDATVKTANWRIVDGNDIISLSSSGTVTGLNPGTALIVCTVNGNVESNKAKVTIFEPELECLSTDPDDNSKEESVFVKPSITYSHTIKRGPAFNKITLIGGGTSVEGDIEISEKKVTFVPLMALKPLATYTLNVPADAVLNKWGSPATEDVTFTFTTSDIEKAKVEMSPVSGSYILSSEAVTLAAIPEDATIYYTLDGSEPTIDSTQYTEPISLTEDVVIKAIAVRDGWYDSEIAVGEYYKSQSEISDCYPVDTKQMYNYAPVVPHIKLSGAVVKSNNFRRISLTDNLGNFVEGSPELTHFIVAFVPNEPLKNGRKYTMDIPRDAVKTLNGEVFKGYSWTFETPVMNVAARMQGDETVYVLRDDLKLKSRGFKLEDWTPANGSFTFKDYTELTQTAIAIDEVDAGYSHHIMRDLTKTRAAGITFCGEIGTVAGRDAAGEAKTVKAGFQTSAIIAEDNSLWMCGRNDFYQLGDGTGTTARDFIKVAENIKDVALGNGFSLWVDCDNVLWAVGRNHRGQLGDGTLEDRTKPVKVIDGVEKVYASASGYFSACITTDGQLLTWGDNGAGQLGRAANGYSETPGEVIGKVAKVALGEAHTLALNENYNLYAWGSNAFSQISATGGNIANPTLFAENVKDMDAGPNTSVILFNSGRVAGYGRKTHCNFGSDAGNAADFTVDAGLPYATLQGVTLVPSKFEALPSEEFALIATPKPLESDYDIIEWTSDRPDVAHIDGNGIIHTSEYGEAQITVRLTDRFGTVKEATATVVCTDDPDNSGCTGMDSANAGASAWTARAYGMTIQIDNISGSHTFSIFNSQGICVFDAHTDSPNITFEAGAKGVYIISDGHKTVKVICL